MARIAQVSDGYHCQELHDGNIFREFAFNERKREWELTVERVLSDEDFAIALPILADGEQWEADLDLNGGAR